MGHSNISPVKRLFRIFKEERKDVRSIFIFAIFHGLVGLSLPLGIQAIITFVQAGRLSTSWFVLVGFVLAGIFVSGYLQLKQMAVSETIEQKLFVGYAFDFARILPRISSNAAEGHYLPEKLNRFFEIGTVQKGVTKLLMDISAAGIQILFGLLLLCFYHPSFIFLSIALVVILYLIFYFTGPRGLESSMEESKYKFELAHWLQEVARTRYTFKLAGKSNLHLERTDDLTSKYLTARLKHFHILVVQFKALIGFKFIVAAVLIVAGSLLVIDNQINIGQFVAAEIVVLLVIASVEKLILSMSTVYDVLTSLDKVGSVTDFDLERDNGQPVSHEKGLELKISNLSFKFPNSNKNLFHDINLHIASGQKIAITGHNGSGKTTLLRILAGLYENYEGTIVVNDLPLRNIKLDAYRSLIGEHFLNQEVFRGTVVENITCGLEGIDMVQVVEATQKTGIDGYIQSLPQGYYTILEPQGAGLPGSVSRKIVEARYLIKRPRLLLIEDNTPFVNPEEREAFFQLVFHHFKHTTMVIVTNDAKLKSQCDAVYSIDHGTLIKNNA